MNKYTFLGVVIFFSIASNSIAARELNIAATEYPPYYSEFIDQQGFMSVIIKEAWQLTDNSQVKFHFLPWKLALEGALNNQYDGLYSVWFSEERAQQFYFSEDIIANEVVFYYNKYNPNIPNNLQWQQKTDLERLTIANVKDYLVPKPVSDYKLQILDTENDQTSFSLLIKGRVDLVLTDRVLGSYLIKQKFNSYQDEIKLILPSIAKKMQYYVISKQDPDGKQKIQLFNKGLKRLKQSGRFNAIVNNF